MVTITRILSDAQNEIGDIAGERIQLGEWLDMLADVAHKVAAKTQVWIARYTVTPNPSTAPVDPVPTSVHIPYTDTLGNTLAPFKFLRILTLRNGQGWQEAREWSFQSIARTAGGAKSFYQNDIQHDSRNFASTFIDPNGAVVDGRSITFPVQFQLDEGFTVDFIQGVPFNYNLWTPTSTVTVPDFLVDVFREGLKWRAMDRLFNKGDDGFMSRADRAQMLYTRYLREAMGYTQMLLDEQSTPQTFPHIWLPE